MTKLYKAALLAALGLASVATSQAASYNSDLLVGFTTQSGNDVVYDLGSSSAILAGTAGVSDTWDLSSFLTGNLSTYSADFWGVIGSQSGTPRVAFTTLQNPPLIPGNSKWGQLNTAATTIYGNFATAGAGQSASVATGSTISWNTETISGSLTTDYVGAYGNPNVQGVTSVALEQVLANGSSPTSVGTFNLSNAGVLSFSPVAVPEPSTYGLLAGAGLLIVSLRNKLARKQA